MLRGSREQGLQGSGRGINLWTSATISRAACCILLLLSASPGIFVIFRSHNSLRTKHRRCAVIRLPPSKPWCHLTHIMRHAQTFTRSCVKKMELLWHLQGTELCLTIPRTRTAHVFSSYRRCSLFIIKVLVNRHDIHEVIIFNYYYVLCKNKIVPTVY